MNQHVATVHEGKKPFKCDICNFSCSQKSNMKKHVAAVHEGNKPFKCAICDYSFFNMLQQFMKEKNRLNVTYVITAAHKKVT